MRHAVLRVLLALALPAGAVTSAPAAEATGSYAVAVAGSAHTMPGLTTTPVVQAVTFVLTFQAAGSSRDAFLVSCLLTGSSTAPETVTTGAGTVTVQWCSGSTTLTGTLQYTRRVSLLTFAGAIVVNGSHHLASGTAVWQSNGVNPSHSFAVAGGMVWN